MRDRNVLVSAAAGSGKTAVLVERIIQMICDEKKPVDIDRLLVVTFTKAAAAEMRERISLGISRELALQPDSEHLQRQAALLHNAQITTIDSFCMFLLKNHFHEIGLDPAFRIMDEGERRLLLADVMGELLEERFAAGEESFLHCVEVFCPGGREEALEEAILELFDMAESHPWPEEWLQERKKDYPMEGEGELLETAYGDFLSLHVRRLLESCKEGYRRLQALCQEPDGPHMYGAMVDEEIEQLESILGCTRPEELALRIPAMNFGRLSSAKDPTVDPRKREQAKEIRTSLKNIIQSLGNDLFQTPLSLAREQSMACAAPVAELVDLTLEFRKRVRAKKQEKKMLDFSDAEHLALEILVHREPAESAGGNGEGSTEGNAVTNAVASQVASPVASQVAKEYRQHFHEIMIDEYQDSNLVQEMLLWAISGEEDGCFNRFMVGDVKQSIYKFRLARPELFLEKYKSYTAKDEHRCRIDLSKNFRSREEVIHTVNGVFTGLMQEENGGIVYDEHAALYCGARYPENTGCESELLLVGKGTDDGEMTSKQAEALAIAERIRGLMGSFQVTEKSTGELRPISYRDIVILLRTNAGWDEEFKTVLEGEGIPVFVTTKTGYFAAAEVQELLQLLRVLDNPLQDIPLFGVLRSVFGGFTEEEIARIRSEAKQELLWDALTQYALTQTASEYCTEGTEDVGAASKTEEKETAEGKTTVDPKLAEKVAAFLEKIKRYRKDTAYLPIRELLQELVRENDYLAYVTALPMGSRRRANVEMLFTKASEFEKTSYHGLFHFIRYMEQLEKYQVDYGEAELQDENADVVRIMSIHKSKGLEFPVTFVAGMSKRFNMQDTNGALIVDADLGIGMDYVDPVRRIRNKTLRAKALVRRKREENLAEELRVLYVAMTRPKEKLIMTAGVSMEQATELWERAQEQTSRALLYHEFVDSKCYLDFVLPLVQQAGIQVQVTDPGLLEGGKIREQVALAHRAELLAEAGTYADPVLLEELKARFAWEYPYSNLKKLYTKTTVSELKIAAMAEKDEAAFHAFEEPEVVPFLPGFERKEEKISGTTRGNAYHKVMELMEYEEIYKEVNTEALSEQRQQEKLRSNLRAFLNRQRALGRLSEEYGAALHEGKLLVFLSNSLALRMYRAAQNGKLYREQPFVYGISAGRLGEDYPQEEQVLIQGIIDAFFVEEDALVLVDYKTDAVKSASELWERYETQLEYYEEALCRLMQLPVKEKVLYSFALGKTVEQEAF